MTEIINYYKFPNKTEEELDKEIYKKSPWISTKDRLPDDEGWKFICNDDMGKPQSLDIAYYDAGGERWMDCHDCSTNNVDYWMEIPEF